MSENKLPYLFSRFYSFLNRHRNIAALFGFIAITATIYSPVVFFNKSLQAPIYHPYSATEEGVYGYEGRRPFGAFNVDTSAATIDQFPQDKFRGDSYKNGSFPFWNPYKGMGEPVLSELNAGQFFPYQILEDISPVKSWDFFYLGRLIIAGFFSFLFLRSLKLSFLGSFLGGIIYMFSGGFVWFINNELMVNTAMMIPILLLSTEMFLQNQSGLYIAILALSFGLILAAGPPGVAIYAILLSGVYFLFRIFLSRKPIVPEGISGFLWSKKGRILLFFFVLILAAGLASPLISPFVEFMKLAVVLRTDLGSAAVRPIYFGFTIFPTLSDVPVNYRFGVSNGLWDDIGSFIGFLSAYFIILGAIISFFFKSHLKKTFLFFLIFGLLILLKNYGLPVLVLIGKLPFIKEVYSPRWSGPVWSFSLAMATAISFEIIRANLGQIRIRFQKVLRSNFLKFSVPILVAAFIALYFRFLADFITKQKDNIFLIKGLGGIDLIFYFFTTYALFLVATFIIFYLKDEKKIFPSLVGLFLLELWFIVPRGYQLQELKLIPFILGLAAIVFFIYKPKIWPILFLALFFISFNIIDARSRYGLPERFNSFNEPPYVTFLKNQSGNFRSIGSDGVLMPNYSTAFNLPDFRYIVGMIDASFYSFSQKVIGINEHPFWFLNTRYSLTPRDQNIFKSLCPGKTYSKSDQKIVFNKRLPFYSLLGIKYILIPADKSIEQVFDIVNPKEFPLVYDKEIKIYENTRVLPRAFIANQAEAADSYGQAQEKLIGFAFQDFRRKIILESSLSELKEGGLNASGGRSLNNDNSNAIIKSYSPNKITIEANTSKPGALVLTDLFYPGWKAKINGTPEKIYRADGLFRAVYLKPGHNEVVFEYLPESFTNGLKIFLISVLVVFLLVFIGGKYKFYLMPIIFILLAFIVYKQSSLLLGYVGRSGTEANVVTNTVNEKRALLDRRLQSLEFVSISIKKLATILGAETRPIIDSFDFTQTGLNTFYVNYHEDGNNNLKKRILIKIVKPNDSSYSYDKNNKNISQIVEFLFNSLLNTPPDKYDQMNQLKIPDEIKIILKNSGILRITPYYWIKNNKLLEIRLYIVSAYYEFRGNQWVFKAGSKNINNNANFNDHLEYDCGTATWR